MNDPKVDIPPVNQRIRSIIDSDYGESVRAFCIALGFSDSQKINRLFNPDTRNGKYPKPSIDVLSLISNKLGVSLLWLQNGEGDKLKRAESDEISADLSVGNIVIPREVWKLIDSKDRQMDEMVSSLKIKDQQTSEVITILKESIDMLKSEIDKKGDGVAEVGRVAPRAAEG